MHKKRTLKSNFLFALGGNIFYMACQYLILMLFTKNFTQESVGSYLFAIAFVSPIVIPSDMQLRSFYVTERSEDLGFHEYRSFRIISNSIAILFVAGAALIFQPALFNTIILVGLIKIIECQVDMYYAAAQKAERMDFISFSKILRGVATLILAYIGVKSGFSVDTVLLLWLLLWICFLPFDRKLALRIARPKRNHPGFFNKKSFIAIFKICAPVLVLLIVFQYYMNFPNYVIKGKLGLASLAIFGSIIYFRSIGAQVINPLGAVVAPRMADYLKTNRHADFKYLLLRTTVLSFLLGLAGILVVWSLGSYILQIVYTKDYAAYSDMLMLVMVYCTVTYMYVFTGTALTCLRIHWVKLPIHVISFAVMALLTYRDYEHITLNGMVINMIIAELVSFILYTVAFIILYKRIRNNATPPVRETLHFSNN